MWASLQDDKTASALAYSKTNSEESYASNFLSTQNSSSRHIFTKSTFTHHKIHVQVTMCTKAKVTTGIFQADIALM